MTKPVTVSLNAFVGFGQNLACGIGKGLPGLQRLFSPNPLLQHDQFASICGRDLGEKTTVYQIYSNMSSHRGSGYKSCLCTFCH